MKRLLMLSAKLNRVIQTLQRLFLGIIIGGILVLGACVAPMVFRSLPPFEAATLMGPMFKRFDSWLFYLTIGVLIVEIILQSWQKSIVLWRTLLLSALLAMVSMSIFVLNPGVDALHQQGVRRGTDQKGSELNRLHRQAEGAYKVIVVLSIGLLL
jgi:hypothetical protein